MYPDGLPGNPGGLRDRTSKNITGPREPALNLVIVHAVPTRMSREQIGTTSALARGTTEASSGDPREVG